MINTNSDLTWMCRTRSNCPPDSSVGRTGLVWQSPGPHLSHWSSGRTSTWWRWPGWSPHCTWWPWPSPLCVWLRLTWGISQVLLTNILRWEGRTTSPLTGEVRWGESSNTEQTRDHPTVQHNTTHHSVTEYIYHWSNSVLVSKLFSDYNPICNTIKCFIAS